MTQPSNFFSKNSHLTNSKKRKKKKRNCNTSQLGWEMLLICASLMNYLFYACLVKLSFSVLSKHISVFVFYKIWIFRTYQNQIQQSCAVTNIKVECKSPFFNKVAYIFKLSSFIFLAYEELSNRRNHLHFHESGSDCYNVISLWPLGQGCY